ncbi:MAG: hypothetical protein FGM27_00850 [Candidatus Omnitrophica bacterium]|nr:hypothetical protein [Candidatus Omnitrophota bacterium]
MKNNFWMRCLNVALSVTMAVTQALPYGHADETARTQDNRTVPVVALSEMKEVDASADPTRSIPSGSIAPITDNPLSRSEPALGDPNRTFPGSSASYQGSNSKDPTSRAKGFARIENTSTTNEERYRAISDNLSSQWASGKFDFKFEKLVSVAEFGALSIDGEIRKFTLEMKDRSGRVVSRSFELNGTMPQSVDLAFLRNEANFDSDGIEGFSLLHTQRERVNFTLSWSKQRNSHLEYKPVEVLSPVVTGTFYVTDDTIPSTLMHSVYYVTGEGRSWLIDRRNEGVRKFLDTLHGQKVSFIPGKSFYLQGKEIFTSGILITGEGIAFVIEEDGQVKTYKNAQFVTVSESRCPANPAMGAPCSVQETAMKLQEIHRHVEVVLRDGWVVKSAIVLEGIRFESGNNPPDGDSPEDIALAALADLAKRTGRSADLFKVQSVKAENWPNGCLGLAEPGIICTMATVRGYRIVIVDETGKIYVYRSALRKGRIVPEPLEKTFSEAVKRARMDIDKSIASFSVEEALDPEGVDRLLTELRQLESAMRGRLQELAKELYAIDPPQKPSEHLIYIPGAYSPYESYTQGVELERYAENKLYEFDRSILTGNLKLLHPGGQSVTLPLKGMIEVLMSAAGKDASFEAFSELLGLEVKHSSESWYAMQVFARRVIMRKLTPDLRSALIEYVRMNDLALLSKDSVIDLDLFRIALRGGREVLKAALDAEVSGAKLLGITVISKNQTDSGLEYRLTVSYLTREGRKMSADVIVLETAGGLEVKVKSDEQLLSELHANSKVLIYEEFDYVATPCAAIDGAVCASTKKIFYSYVRENGDRVYQIASINETRVFGVYGVKRTAMLLNPEADLKGERSLQKEDVIENLLSDLEQRLGKPREAFELVIAEDVWWPDSCLGVRKGICKTMGEAGFVIVFREKNGQTHQYHTGINGRYIYLELESDANLEEKIALLLQEAEDLRDQAARKGEDAQDLDELASLAKATAEQAVASAQQEVRLAQSMKLQAESMLKAAEKQWARIAEREKRVLAEIARYQGMRPSLMVWARLAALNLERMSLNKERNSVLARMENAKSEFRKAELREQTALAGLAEAERQVQAAEQTAKQAETLRAEAEQLLLQAELKTEQAAELKARLSEKSEAHARKILMDQFPGIDPGLVETVSVRQVTSEDLADKTSYPKGFVGVHLVTLKIGSFGPELTYIGGVDVNDPNYRSMAIATQSTLNYIDIPRAVQDYIAKVQGRFGDDFLVAAAKKDENQYEVRVERRKFEWAWRMIDEAENLKFISLKFSLSSEGVLDSESLSAKYAHVDLADAPLLFQAMKLGKSYGIQGSDEIDYLVQFARHVIKGIDGGRDGLVFSELADKPLVHSRNYYAYWHEGKLAALRIQYVKGPDAGLSDRTEVKDLGVNAQGERAVRVSASLDYDWRDTAETRHLDEIEVSESVHRTVEYTDRSFSEVAQRKETVDLGFNSAGYRVKRVRANLADDWFLTPESRFFDEIEVSENTRRIFEYTDETFKTVRSRTEVEGLGLNSEGRPVQRVRTSLDFEWRDTAETRHLDAILERGHLMRIVNYADNSFSSILSRNEVEDLGWNSDLKRMIRIRTNLSSDWTATGDTEQIDKEFDLSDFPWSV